MLKTNGKGGCKRFSNFTLFFWSIKNILGLIKNFTIKQIHEAFVHKFILFKDPSQELSPLSLKFLVPWIAWILLGWEEWLRINRRGSVDKAIVTETNWGFEIHKFPPSVVVLGVEGLRIYIYIYFLNWIF